MSLQVPTAWSFQLGTHVVPNNLNVPQYRWFPDAHFATIKNTIEEQENDPDSKYIMFWSGNKN
jgi:hypothetical protein